jgi:hypothetical protein
MVSASRLGLLFFFFGPSPISWRRVWSLTLSLLFSFADVAPPRGASRSGSLSRKLLWLSSTRSMKRMLVRFVPISERYAPMWWRRVVRSSEMICGRERMSSPSHSSETPMRVMRAVEALARERMDSRRVWWERMRNTTQRTTISISSPRRDSCRVSETGWESEGEDQEEEVKEAVHEVEGDHEQSHLKVGGLDRIAEGPGQVLQGTHLTEHEGGLVVRKERASELCLHQLHGLHDALAALQRKEGWGQKGGREGGKGTFKLSMEGKAATRPSPPVAPLEAWSCWPLFSMSNSIFASRARSLKGEEERVSVGHAVQREEGLTAPLR